MKQEELMKYFDEKFDAQTEIFNGRATHIVAETRSLIDATNERLDTIVEQNRIRNSRIEKGEEHIGKLEKEVNGKIVEVETKVNNIIGRCSMIQENKASRVISNRWFIGIALTLLTIFIMWTGRKISRDQKIPVELFFQKTDSTLHVPRMYLRSDDGALREVHVDYFDIIRNGTGQ